MYCLARHEEALYAATEAVHGSDSRIGQVWRRESDGNWLLVGDGLDDRVNSLASYQGELYAGTAWAGGRLYRYEGGTAWTRVVDAENWWSVGPLWVANNGYLYLGGWLPETIGRFNGRAFYELANLSLDWFIGDFSEYGGELFAASTSGTGSGRVYRSPNGLHWELALHYGEADIWDLEHFQGYLYLGDAHGRLVRIDDPGNVTSVWTAPDTIAAMLAHGRQRLYFSTVHDEDNPMSRVYAYNGTDTPQLISDIMNRSVICLYIPHQFCDIRGEHWAFEEIEACYQAGVVAGYPNGHYYARWTVTRDQMAVYIARALAGGDENIPPGGRPGSFFDVRPHHWAFDHIEYCVDKGVVVGYGLRLYNPEYEVTRDEMAAYMARALVAPEGDAGLADYIPADPRNFPDVASDSWAYRHIEYCVEKGVVEGYEDGHYHPEYVVTRDQMAVYISRAFGLGL